MIGVVMCTYNGARFLSEQLASIAAQSVPVDEIVICDDGSTDRTCDIVEDFASSHPGLVRFQRNPSRLGYSQNFARALSLSRSDIIFLSDQDDVWLSTRVAGCVNIFHHQPECGLISTAATVTDERLTPTGKLLAPFAPNASSAATFVDRFRTSFAYGCTLALRSSLLPLLLPISQFWAHDNWICFLAATLSQTVAINEPQMLYRRHGGSAGLNDSIDFSASRQALSAMRRSKGSDYRVDHDAWNAMQHHLEHLLHPEFTPPLSDSVRQRATTILRDVGARAEFSLARLRMAQKPRPLRVLSALHMLSSGHYAEYVSGWKSFMRDLLTA